MKKTLLLIFLITVALGISSCKRGEIVDPSWDGPAGFHILLEGAATPALLIIDGHVHSSEIYVRVTNAQGTPLAGETIFFEQLASSLSTKQLTWGYFVKKSATTYKAVTNANGEIRVRFYSPLTYHSSIMFIHALMQVDGRAYRDISLPQDYIAISMIKSGTGAAPVIK
jgi:hypothetical protein